MVFNDVVEMLNINKAGMEELTLFIDQLNETKSMYDDKVTYIVSANVNSQVNTSNCITYKENFNTILSTIRNKLQQMNLLKIGKILNSLEKENNNWSNNYLFADVLHEIDSYCDNVYKYLTFDNQQQANGIIDLMNKTEALIYKINNFKIFGSYLNEINLAIENTYSQKK